MENGSEVAGWSIKVSGVPVIETVEMQKGLAERHQESLQLEMVHEAFQRRYGIGIWRHETGAQRDRRGSRQESVSHQHIWTVWMPMDMAEIPTGVKRKKRRRSRANRERSGQGTCKTQCLQKGLTNAAEGFTTAQTKL